MKAMVLTRLSRFQEAAGPLVAMEVPDPVPGAGEILLRVATCGVCHTDLDEIEGRMPPPNLPVIPGHQVVGRVVARGDGASRFDVGARVGVAWIFSACGECERCRRGEENLCEDFRATGRDANGGYAELMTVPEAFAYRIPDVFSDEEAAPLLCAGAIGYRSVALTGLGATGTLGLTGFGASAHLVLKWVRDRFPGLRVFVFARDRDEREFARELGAEWAGHTRETPPQALDAIIDTTPAWGPVIAALNALRPGGRLVINAIRKEDQDSAALLDLDYAKHLWMEKEIKSVANVTRADVEGFLAVAAQADIRPVVEVYPLAAANSALRDLREKRIRGARVLRIG